MLPLLTWTALPSLTCANKLEVTTFPRLNQTGEGFTSSLNGSLEEVATSSLNVGHAGWDIKVWPKFWSLLSFCLVFGFCFLVKICFTVLTFWWSLVGAFWTKNCLKRVLEQSCCTHFCAQSDLVVEGTTHYSESRSYTGGSLREFVALHYERHPESVRGCLGWSCGRWLRAGASADPAPCLKPAGYKPQFGVSTSPKIIKIQELRLKSGSWKNPRTLSEVDWAILRWDPGLPQMDQIFDL